MNQGVHWLLAEIELNIREAQIGSPISPFPLVNVLTTGSKKCIERTKGEEYSFIARILIPEKDRKRSRCSSVIFQLATPKHSVYR
jgi:hypothetical protein